MKTKIFLCLWVIPTILCANNFDDRLKACKVDPDQNYCMSKVLLDAMKEIKPGGTASHPMCQCQCGGLNPATPQCNLYYIESENSQILANGISPRDCVDALKYPPCR